MGIGAFLIWSFTPFYFEAIQQLQVVEIVAHRFLWCIPFMALVLTLARQWADLFAALRNRRVLATLFLTAALISVNWSMFIFTVGYFLSPLVNVLLGFVVLRERLSNGQRIAVALAAIGVGIQILAFGQVPWIALVIAFSFGSYGLLRKTVAAGPAVGLFVECAHLVLGPGHRRVRTIRARVRCADRLFRRRHRVAAAHVRRGGPPGPTGDHRADAIHRAVILSAVCRDLLPAAFRDG